MKTQSKAKEDTITTGDAVASVMGQKYWYSLERTTAGYTIHRMKLVGDEVVIDRIGEPNLKRYQIAKLIERIYHDTK